MPLAVTDNLNFGNPERPETMGDIVASVDGIAEACRALDFPVVSGNCSLYNETNGEAILPTPAIGGVGLLRDVKRMATIAFKSEGETIILIGETQGHLGQSLYLREIEGREEGPPPPVDLAAEKRNGDFVRSLIEAGRADTVHDVSDGGLLVAIAEMAMGNGIGARLSLTDDGIASLFGEDQARYVLTVVREASRPRSCRKPGARRARPRHRHDGRRRSCAARRRLGRRWLSCAARMRPGFRAT